MEDFAGALPFDKGGLELDDNDAHVVAPHARPLRGRRQAVVARLLTDLRETDPLPQAVPDEVYGLLVRHHVPDPVACQDDELVAIVDLGRRYLGQRRDGLRLRGQVPPLLVLHVPEGPAQIQAPVHPALCDEAPSGCDARVLVRVCELVVPGAPTPRPSGTARTESRRRWLLSAARRRSAPPPRCTPPRALRRRRCPGAPPAS